MLSKACRPLPTPAMKEEEVETEVEADQEVVAEARRGSYL